MQRELLTTKEVAEMLGFHVNSIYALVEAGKLPVVRLGKDLRFPRVKILALIDGRPCEAPEGLSVGEEAL